MDIIGERKFVEVPGEKRYELPPLLVRYSTHVRRLDRVMNLANDIIDSDDMMANTPADKLVGDLDLKRRKMDLALNLVDQYLELINHWQWGADVLAWIRQCETTFGIRQELHNLLKPDVWPHAGRSSFVTLLTDKSVKTYGVDLTKAVGLRLTFRQAPPISIFSDQFLVYLNDSVAQSAYETWSGMVPDPVCALPPERFDFQVCNINLME